MLCSTGSETTVAAIENRISRCPAAKLHEVRLDHLTSEDPTRPSGALDRLLSDHGAKLLMCFRAERQGGARAMGETERLRVLVAVSGRSRFVDVESDVEDAWLDRIGRDKVVLSHHAFDAAALPDLNDPVVTRLAEARVAVTKLALAVSDAADLGRLLAIKLRLPNMRVLIGMGRAGQLSRTAYRRFGSAWTYVAGGISNTTAPGQLDYATALRIGLPGSGDEDVMGLVGGPRIFTSPGAQVYNAYFRANGLPWSYVPIETGALGRLLPTLETLGCAGLSVTMPLKQQAALLSTPDPHVPPSSRCPPGFPVNSLRYARDHSTAQNPNWLSCNTDVRGIVGPLSTSPPIAKPVVRALILGAGGAAHAAAAACRQLDYRTTVTARRIDAARALAKSVGEVEVRAWEKREGAAFDLVINATPVTGKNVPISVPALCRHARPQLVFDTAMASNRSQLLHDASARGIAVLGPLDMWLHQGAAQLAWMTGRDVQPDLLRHHLLLDPQSPGAANQSITPPPSTPS